MQRVRAAGAVIIALETARRHASDLPQTRRYIGRCLKSAQGALRHALAVMGRFDQRFRERRRAS